MSGTVGVRVFYQELEFQYEELATSTLAQVKTACKNKFNSELNTCLGRVPELKVEVFPDGFPEDTALSNITNCTPLALVTPVAIASPIYTQAKEAKRKSKSKNKKEKEPNLNDHESKLLQELEQIRQELKRRDEEQKKRDEERDNALKRRDEEQKKRDEERDREQQRRDKEQQRRDEETQRERAQLKLMIEEQAETVKFLLPSYEKMRKIRLRTLIDTARRKLIQLLEQNGITDLKPSTLVEYLTSNSTARQIVFQLLGSNEVLMNAIIGSKFREPGHLSAHVCSQEDLEIATRYASEEDEPVLKAVFDFTFNIPKSNNNENN